MAGAGPKRPTRERKEEMYRSTKRTLMVIMAALVLAASPIGAGEPLTIRVSPGFAFAPATLVVNAVAQPHPANRALHIDLMSSDYYRSSVIPLDGDQGAITTTVRYDGVPGGKYEVSAILLGSSGTRRAAPTRTVEILSNPGH